MPWFPEFVSAAELARKQARDEGHADPVAQYLRALDTGDARDLEYVWPGDVVVHDPRAGEVHGHAQLRQFVRRNTSWLANHRAHVETVASTTDGRRAVVELLARVEDDDGRATDWPVAVVAESPDDRSVVFRTYCSQWPVDGRRHVRPPVLPAGRDALDGVVGRFQAALAGGDVDAVMSAFADDAYLRESFGPHGAHRGSEELRAYFTTSFGAGGGIELEACTVTQDGARSAVEYNCVRWGDRDLPPQAGVAVYERGADDRLTAVRLYDDIEPPLGPA
ncbi:nuclear transport factor 2 family protein [Cellulomonas sp. ICMP 17802]|uniref:nuclear transport factor 2 family protein n=1 Tax=Cellulomonas sp. ICMP 17802 TaxID=3239199 RepID=UPI00351B0BA2